MKRCCSARAKADAFMPVGDGGPAKAFASRFPSYWLWPRITRAPGFARPAATRASLSKIRNTLSESEHPGRIAVTCSVFRVLFIERCEMHRIQCAGVFCERSTDRAARRFDRRRRSLRLAITLSYGRRWLTCRRSSRTCLRYLRTETKKIYSDR